MGILTTWSPYDQMKLVNSRQLSSFQLHKTSHQVKPSCVSVIHKRLVSNFQLLPCTSHFLLYQANARELKCISLGHMWEQDCSSLLLLPQGIYFQHLPKLYIWNINSYHLIRWRQIYMSPTGLVKVPKTSRKVNMIKEAISFYKNRSASSRNSSTKEWRKPKKFQWWKIN